MTARLALGVDVGGTKIAGCLIDASGGRHGPVLRTPTPRTDPASVVAAIVRLAHEVDADQRAVTIGVGSAGVFDAAGVVASATDILPGWAGTDLSGALNRALGIPAVALNDVHAAALGEGRVGAAQGVASFLMVAIGTGIGGAAVLNGRLVVGAHGVAGSIGHTPVAEAAGLRCSCGRLGHLEALASGPALEARYRERSARPDVTLSEMPDDEFATEILSTAATGLGTALAGAAALLDPQLIVIGGGVSTLGGRLLDPTREAFRDHAFGPAGGIPVVETTLDASATVIGAAIAAFDALE